MHAAPYTMLGRIKSTALHFGIPDVVFRMLHYFMSSKLELLLVKCVPMSKVKKRRRKKKKCVCTIPWNGNVIAVMLGPI